MSRASMLQFVCGALLFLLLLLSVILNDSEGPQRRTNRHLRTKLFQYETSRDRQWPKSFHHCRNLCLAGMFAALTMTPRHGDGIAAALKNKDQLPHSSQ